MKDQILKIAKVKSEKEFYKKYPTEEAFMKAHKKEFKKAAMGSKMVNDQLHQLTDFGNPPIAQYGVDMPKQNFNKYLQGTSQFGMNPDGSMKQVGDAFNNASMAKMSGQQMASDMSAQFAPPTSDSLLGKNAINSGGAPKTGGITGKAAGMAALGAIPGIIGGIEAIGAQKKARKKAQQSAELSGLALTAQQTNERPKNQYVRAEDNMVQPGQLGNPYGNKTNYLQAQDGAMIGGNPTEIQNMYNPGDMYNDLGFEPLEETYKQYQNGGKKHLSSERIETSVRGVPGVAIRDIYQHPNMTQDTAYSYNSPTAMLKYETNGSKPFAYVGGRGGFTSAQPDSLAKYKGLLSAPFERVTNLQSGERAASATERLARGNYENGGDLPKAEFGEYFQDSGEAQIGSSVGTAAGTLIGGPLGGMVGGLIGKGLGNVFGGAKNARKLQAEKDKTAMNQSMMGFMQNRSQGPLSANVKNGGWISHDWQPQTFTKFGEYSAKDLLRPPHDADMLRSGGHIAQVGYTAPSAEALQTYEYGGQMALGGELQIGDGGYAETLSYNPNLPGGEIGMFRGASHDNGGIQTQYGENGVEVEGGEPFTVLEDNGSEDGNNLEGGGSKENLVVFGNIKINKEIADLMGDPKAKGKKFKTYIADIAKNDAKQLKKINKGLELIEGANENSAFDHLTLNTGKVMLQGAKAWQKINADKIKEAGLVQDSIHKTANELGVKSDKLAEGKLEKETDPSMMGKNGKKMKKAQGGISMSSLKGLDDEALLDPDYPERMELLKAYYEASDINRRMMREGKSNAGFMGLGVNNLDEVVVTGNRNKSKRLPGDIVPYERLEVPQAPQQFTGKMPDIKMKKMKRKGKGINWPDVDWKKLGDIGKTALSYAEPWLRPSNANEDLNPDQLMGEYYALANNQLDPVQSQQYQPMLDTPYDISFNDQINAIDSQSRAALRASGSNPAAQAMIMAQTIEAKNKLFGESNRVNQTNKMGVYDKNRATINDAKLKNLAINDQQYVRQSQSKSNTKAQTQAALNSISAKVAQQRASNRKLGIMENMYNFRFSPSGRAINYNGFASFDTSGMNARRSGLSSAGLPTNKRFTIDSVTGEPVGIRTLTKDEMAGNGPSMSEVDSYLDTQKKGGKTPKIKARNISIVKALKSL